MTDTFGHNAGDRCYRNGCIGTISTDAPADHEHGCSCHINPPCGFCTTDWAHCDECGWKASDDDNYIPVPTEYAALYVMERVKPRPLDPRKIDYRTTSHSNASQKVTGVYPDGVTRAEVEARVCGTFGGRFTSFGNGKFEYIAYTD